MTIVLKDLRVLGVAADVDRGTVVVGPDGRIRYAGPSAAAPEVEGAALALPGHTVAAGLIDIHTHGGHGITFGAGAGQVVCAALEADLRAYAAWVATTGVTGFLLSIAAPDRAALHTLVEIYAAIFSAWPDVSSEAVGARPLGLHLEGPYLNPVRKGAFNPTWLRAPRVQEVEALIDAGQGWVRQMTLAPELPGALEVAALLRRRGVVPALGHSETDYESAAAALRDHFNHVTHAFNAQLGFHHRRPGVLGAVLTSDGVTAELIADTVHVHPGAMKVLLRCLGTGRVVLVTDAMAAAGLGDGRYDLLGETVFVKDGQARHADGTIASSTATLDLCVRNMVRVVGVTLPEALAMASHNPARALGLEDRFGSLAEGRVADLVVLDPDLRVALTVVGGQIVYQAGL